jgi:hypothetical protein
MEWSRRKEVQCTYCTECGSRVEPFAAGSAETQRVYSCPNCLREHPVPIYDPPYTGTICPGCGSFWSLSSNYCAICGRKMW